jgi:hypothetical protein
MTIEHPMFPPSQRGEGALSALFTDPSVADAFARAERGTGSMFAVPTPCPGPLTDGAAVRPAHEAGGAFDQNLQRLCAAANLAYGLAINPQPIPALLHGACAGADPQLGRDLLDVVAEGHDIGRSLVELMAAVRRSLEEVAR